MIDNDKEYSSIYIVDNTKNPKRKIWMILLFILIIIEIIIIIGYCINSIKQNNIYKQYEEQLLSIQYQEKEKMEKIEAEKERIRQERIPKLTQTRKR